MLRTAQNLEAMRSKINATLNGTNLWRFALLTIGLGTLAHRLSGVRAEGFGECRASIGISLRSFALLRIGLLSAAQGFSRLHAEGHAPDRAEGWSDEKQDQRDIDPVVEHVAL